MNNVIRSIYEMQIDSCYKLSHPATLERFKLNNLSARIGTISVIYSYQFYVSTIQELFYVLQGSVMAHLRPVSGVDHD